MTFAWLIKEKKQENENIVKKYSLVKKNKALCLIKLSDSKIVDLLSEWLCVLPANFVICGSWKTNVSNVVYNENIEVDEMKWFDAVVCDDCLNDLQTLIKYGIVPIINSGTHLNNILSEFSPVKNQWNAYIYNTKSAWDIYYAIVRYIENYKFPFDNKNLVRNISEM